MKHPLTPINEITSRTAEKSGQWPDHNGKSGERSEIHRYPGETGPRWGLMELIIKFSGRNIGFVWENAGTVVPVVLGLPERKVPGDSRSPMDLA